MQSVFITMYIHVEKLPAILRYEITFTYDAPAITRHSAFHIQGPPGPLTGWSSRQLVAEIECTL
jgi:hypothetical protein